MTCARCEDPTYERTPLTPPVCPSCIAQLEEYAQMVKDGGVYFSCEACGCGGVIQAGAFAAMIRKDAGVPPPEPCGVQFVDCDQHDPPQNDPTYH